MRVTSDERLHVLLVEDDAGVAATYRLKLELDGYQVQVATDGSNALRVARNAAPDIIFLDLELPDMHGLEVLQQLRVDPLTASVPVLILTNHDEPELKEQGLKLGAREFLIKARTSPAAVSSRVSGQPLPNLGVKK